MNDTKILLASSLFYFRIPREVWEVRMKLLKTAGYNAIDVYFPWNYHETAPGEWDFSGNRDVRAFLELAAVYELQVIARPGPYICSEWDGGGMPAWLAAEQVDVRQDNPEFLRRIGSWYEHILPILQPYQITNGGPIICMQIENELDFFDCKSPVSYMEKLMKKARKLGIGVPLFYCCGQNDLLRSGGLTPGLYTSFNVYSDGNSPVVEERLLHLYSSVSDRNMPLLITETNREHNYLKRLFACGAKLLGPYNQTAGTTTGWYNGITNWGTNWPHIALMASDYDFCSMIGSAGEVNEQFYESRLLAGLIRSFPEAFRNAVPKKAQGVQVEPGKEINGIIPLLHTKRGDLMELTNLNKEDTITIYYLDYKLTLQMAKGETKLLPFDFCLSDTFEMVLCCSNYEIGYVQEELDGVKLAMYGEGDFYAVAEHSGERKTIEISRTAGQPPVIHEDIGLTVWVGSPRDIALGFIPGLPDMAITVEEQREEITLLDIEVEEWKRPVVSFTDVEVKYMEELGQYRGIGCYQFQVEEAGDVLLQEAADILTITRDGEVLEVVYGRGNSIIRHLIPGIYKIYVEIWGHSNFDDIRCKSLRMNSLKGIRNIVHLTYNEDISHNWLFDLDEQPIVEWFFFRHSNYNTIMGIDDYNRAVSPLRTLYNKWVTVPEGVDGLYLHFSKTACMIYVYVNGHYEGTVLKDDPYIDISGYTDCERIEICLRTERRYFSDPVGTVTLLGGEKRKRCYYGSVPVEAVEMPKTPESLRLPVALEAKRNYLMRLPLQKQGQKEIKLYFQGKDVKLTIVWKNRIVGRLILDCEEFPEVKGGRGDIVHLLGEWLDEEAPVIWCQPTGKDPRVDAVKVCYFNSVAL